MDSLKAKVCRGEVSLYHLLKSRAELLQQKVDWGSIILLICKNIHDQAPGNCIRTVEPLKVVVELIGNGWGYERVYQRDSTHQVHNILESLRVVSICNKICVKTLNDLPAQVQSLRTKQGCRKIVPFQWCQHLQQKGQDVPKNQLDQHEKSM
jgi:hypothetical protein